MATCFSDAAWSVKTKVCGLGWSIKSSTQELIQQGSSTRPYVASALVAESLALKAALTVALASGVLRVACYSDCQELVSLLKSDGYAIELDGILEDIREINSQFDFIAFNHVPRAENSVADSLAKSALYSYNISSSNGV